MKRIILILGSLFLGYAVFAHPADRYFDDDDYDDGDLYEWGVQINNYAAPYSDQFVIWAGTGIQFPAQRPTVLPPQRILAERPAGRNRTVAPIGISVARRDGLLPARQRPQLDQRFAPFRNRTFVGGLPHHPRQVPRIQSVLERILRAPSSGTGSASRLPPRLVLLPARCAAPSAAPNLRARSYAPAPSASANAGQPSRRSAGHPVRPQRPSSTDRPQRPEYRPRNQKSISGRSARDASRRNDDRRNDREKDRTQKVDKKENNKSYRR